jgi:hypothetical protein
LIDIVRLVGQPRSGGSEDLDSSSLAGLIQRTDGLWIAPRAGEVQPGVNAVFGSRPPTELIGVRLWPVLISSGHGPALVLVDIHYRVRVVVDVARAPGGLPYRPGWVAAATVSYGARMPGSHELWLDWARELSEHAPHDWTPACAEHAHLPRPDPHGQYVTAIPQHDAWLMSRSWVPSDLIVPSIADVRRIVLSRSERPLRARERRIRSRWDAVSFAQFGGVVEGCVGADTAVLRAIEPLMRGTDMQSECPDPTIASQSAGNSNRDT